MLVCGMKQARSSHAFPSASWSVATLIMCRAIRTCSLTLNDVRVNSLVISSWDGYLNLKGLAGL